VGFDMGPHIKKQGIETGWMEHINVVFMSPCVASCPGSFDVAACACRFIMPGIAEI
jgi:hypothetical protein